MKSDETVPADKPAIRIPHSRGFWELREGSGKCAGTKCGKVGGGMVEITGEETIVEGIEKVLDPMLLCGDCFSVFILATPEVVVGDG